MICDNCTINKEVLKILRSKDFGKNRANFSFICRNCVNHFNLLNPNSYVILESGMKRLDFFIEELSFCEIPDIEENSDDYLCKFRVKLAYEDENFVSFYKMILGNFNEFQETGKNSMDDLNSETYTAIYNKIQKKIVSIISLKGEMSLVDRNETLKLEQIDENNAQGVNIIADEDEIIQILKGNVGKKVFKVGNHNVFLFPVN